MRIKKHFLILIILFIIFVPEVKANRGDLRYEITNLKVSNTGLTISGYAFIHQTDNYKTVHKRKSNGDYNGVLKENGGQKVKIKVISTSDKNKFKIFDIDCIGDEDQNKPNDVGYKDYNFYYEHHDAQYSGDYDYLNDFNNLNSAYRYYYYEDMFFTNTFSFDDLSIDGENEIEFEITACNNDYKSTNPSTNGCAPYEAMGVFKGSLNLNGSNTIINESVSTSIVSFVENGKIQQVDKNAAIEKCCNNRYNKFFHNKGDYNEIERTFTIYDYQNESAGYKHGYKANLKHEFRGDQTKFLNGTYSAGKIAVCIDKKDQVFHIDNCESINDSKLCNSCGNNGKLVATYASWAKPTTALRIKPLNDKKCKPVTPNQTALNCNGNKTIQSDCDELTVKSLDGTVKTNVSISQKGTITNVLTPTKTYAGGPFKFGILYRNEISWNYVGTNNLSDSDKSKIQQAMQEKIYDLDTIKNNIKLENITFGEEHPSFDNFNIECNQSGEFSAGETLITYCTIFLPTSIANENDDNVIYKKGGVENKGINNAYYTPLVYENENYTLSAKISGINIIKENYQKSDSKSKDTSWTGDWNTAISGCEIKLYPLLYQTNENTVKFLPIYRPIDINNPFPNNRQPGFNWDAWYSNDSNKQRLKETYSKLQYSISLDQMTINNIKDYNKNHNYLEWEIENNESDFINRYEGKFSILRQNIVGDSK